MKTYIGRVFDLDERRLDAMMTVIDNARIDKRQSICPVDYIVTPRTLTQKSVEHQDHAVRLGREATERCLSRAGVSAGDVDMIITVSCTGFMIPSLDAYLINDMGFRPDVRRLPITELGCAAGDETLDYNYAGFRDLAHVLGLPHIHITDNTINFNGRHSGGQVSGYVQDDIRLGDRVTANVGVRLDRYDLAVTATHASPRVNLAVEVGGGAVVHASYNHYFVPPPIEGVLSSAAGLTSRIREIGVALPPVQPTTEDQFELGATSPVGPLQLGLTGYYRASDNPVHTTVWPDARIYSYATFDHAQAYGLEAKAEIPRFARYGLTGYFNYALGRVYFYNPVTGGFVTEAEHVNSSDRFLAPMDQTHTLTGGLTYRHAKTGLWIGTTLEYGSGTPTEHGESADVHVEGEPAHMHATSADTAERVPGHFTANVSFGVDVLRAASRRPRLSFQIDIENVGNNLYLVAQESEFTPGQYSIPRLFSATARVRF